MSGSVKKILKITSITIASIILLIVIIIAGATLYLTPQRLTEIVNREASQWLKADIKANNIRYTIWSSFPRLAIETDSVTVISRTLKDLPDSITATLPENSDFLASVKSFTGQINVIDFISGRYVIHDAKVDGLRINLVAYNDSVSNYNIVPDDVSGFKKVPYFTAQSVVIRNAGKMQYYSAATQTKADLTLKQLDLTRLDRAPIIGKKTNKYKLTVAGKVTAATDGLTLLDKFPFYLNGDMTLRFDPFGVDLTDYDINLGNVKGKLNMAVGIGDNPSVDKFEYRISSINLMTLLGYLPQKYIPNLTGIQAELPINASARLTSPWLFSSEELPSMQIQLDVPQGDIRYTMAADGNPAWQGKTFTLRHSPINGIFNFDGPHPERSTVAILPFTLSSDGIVCRTDATVTGLTDSPLVNINFNCDADIKKALSYLDIADDINTTGALNADAKLSFRLADFSDAALSEGLRNVNAIADISLADAKIYIPDEKTSAAASLVRINITADAPLLTQNDYSTLTLTPTMTIAAGSANINGNKVACSGLNLYTGNINPTNLRQLNLNLVADRLSYTDGTNTITARRPDIRLNIAKRVTPYTVSSTTRNSAEVENPNSLTSLPHTSEYITVSAPGALRGFLSQYEFNSLIKCAALSEHKSNTTLRDLSATITPDRLTIHRFNTQIQSTRARIAADVSGLRNFLLDTVGVQPLYINLQTDLDTVNINTLAHAWFSSRGGVPQQKTTVSPMASDSIAYLIPRNITARIKASAKETVYTNLHLYDLNTLLTIDNGRAGVNDLNISSDFGHAAMNLTYDTADIDSIGFKADLAITDVNIVNFFKNFHALLMMAPQMKNLDGNLSIYGSVGGSIFPDMVINVPGMYADFNLQGRQLKVHQSNFIRRVTKMMLIDNDNDLHIKDMNVFAHVHGNLLQLDPFLFEFDRYKLRMLGINNFNGDLYYQVGVIENPFHIPFGIKIEGLFHDPKLRFGSTDYDTQKALRISQSIMEQNNINIVNMMKGFMGEFLRKAAQAATDPNLSL